MVPLEDTIGFTSVLQAVRDAPEPRAIPAEDVSVEDFEDSATGRATTVNGIVDLVQSCARGQKLFSEAGARWAPVDH